ncbi:hypothetical protein BC628DRAFT_304655 [Trametes gibbosa]|nr:hypothetical protein BC628DRAFT_304655 [Trametes gibbosa]
MTITHIQSFWDVPVGAGNIGPLQRARLAKATLALGHNPDIVFASFSGGYTNAERPEISLITSAEVEPVSFHSTIKAALVAQDISVEPTVKNETRYHELGATELDNFAAAARVPDLTLAHEAIDELSQLAFQPISADEATPSPTELLEALTAAAPDAPAESFADVSPKQIIQGFSVDVKLFQALRTARGDAIKNHIKGLSNTFGSLKKEKNSNAATAIMVGSGLITVGSKMWSVYAGIKAAGSVSLMISEIIASVGGIVALGGIIAAIAAAFGLLWILLKE